MLILIAGITGSLGQSLAKIALPRGLSVRGLGRNPNNLSLEILDQLESFVKSETYYDIPALEKAVSGVDAVINAYSPIPVLDLDGHLLLLDILLYGEGVQAGNGGIFKIQAGNTTIKELAAVYQKVYGVEVELIRQGSAEELEAKLVKLRSVPAPLAYFGWMSAAAALIASKGLWEMKKVYKLKQFKTPVSLDQWLEEKKSKAC